MVSARDPVTNTNWSFSSSGVKQAVLAFVGISITAVIVGMALNVGAPAIGGLMPMTSGQETTPDVQLGA